MEKKATITTAVLLEGRYRLLCYAAWAKPTAWDFTPKCRRCEMHVAESGLSRLRYCSHVHHFQPPRVRASTCLSFVPSWSHANSLHCQVYAFSSPTFGALLSSMEILLGLILVSRTRGHRRRRQRDAVGTNTCLAWLPGP